MRFVPLLIAGALSLACAPAIARLLERSGLVRKNYRGAELPTAGGVVCVFAICVALIPISLLDHLAGASLAAPGLAVVLVYVLGVAGLGLLDDAASSRSAGGPRGLEGHGRALVTGSVSTGIVKAAGTVGLALYAASLVGGPAWRYLAAAATLVLCPHVFNLLDLRPGRVGKVYLLAAVVLPLATWRAWPLEVTALAAGAALGPLPFDLRERLMLGDTGASLVGAVCGLWLVLYLPAPGVVAAGVLLIVVALYGEMRSLDRLIARTPVLREVDSLGRPSHG